MVKCKSQYAMTLMSTMILASSALTPITNTIIQAPSIVQAAENLDSWMPDKALQQIVLATLKNPNLAINGHGGAILSDVSGIKPEMMQDITQGLGAEPTGKGVTNLTGLEKLTAIVGNIRLGLAEPEIIPKGLAAVLNKANYNDIGHVMVTKKTNVDELRKIDASRTKRNITIKEVVEGKTIIMDKDASSQRAYIPYSDWYAGLAQPDGSMAYGNVALYVDGNTPLPDGMAQEDANKRFVVDLSKLAGKHVKFKISYSDTNVYEADSWFDATMPKPAATDSGKQLVDVTSRKNPTGTIKTKSKATAKSTYTVSGDLTKDDVTFVADKNGQVTYKLTATGQRKVQFGDKTIKLAVATDGAVENIDVTFAEALDTWMPDKTMQEQIGKLIGGKVTKTTINELKSVSVSGVKNIQGLEYAQNALKLSIDNSTIAPKNDTGATIINKMAALEELTVQNSDIGTDTTAWNLQGSPRLTNVILRKDKLTKVDIKALESLKNLEHLDLGENQLAIDLDKTPINWKAWPNLNYVGFENNKLTGHLPEFKDNPKMNQINFMSNQLSGTVPEFYGSLKNLEYLQLSYNKLTGELPKTIGQLPKMKYIYLGANQFTGTIPTEWKSFTELERLYLHDNKLTGDLNTLGGLTTLKEVNVNKNAFTGVLPSAWFTTNLTHFEAGYNKLSGDLPKSMSTATNLNWLDIASNQFTGDLPDLTKAKDLRLMAYGANHITSGRTVASVGGNYQQWDITNPDWKWTSDGSKLELDLSPYYGGEEGQKDYSFIGLHATSGERGVSLDKSDVNHPKLVIDTTDTNVGDMLKFELYDQVGKQAVYSSDGINGMNYHATVTVPVNWDSVRTVGIEATDVDFGTHNVGAGEITATDFKLRVVSTGSKGVTYQVTAKTDGLKDGAGNMLPLMYEDGDSTININESDQLLTNYVPKTSDDSTIIGDSLDKDKSNLATLVSLSSRTGDYHANVTYTVGNTPTGNPGTVDREVDLSKITPDMVQETVHHQKVTEANTSSSAVSDTMVKEMADNVFGFVEKTLLDENAVPYKDVNETKNNTGEQLSETSGLWLLSLAIKGDEAQFEKTFNGLVKTLYDEKTNTFSWRKHKGEEKAPGNASIDDLRIVQALLLMNQKHKTPERTAWLKKLVAGFVKYDLNNDGYMINSYDGHNQETRIRLNYLDLSTLKAVNAAAGIPDSAYEDQLKVILGGKLQGKLPWFLTYYDYSTGKYLEGGDSGKDRINVTDSMLTMLNLAKVNKLPSDSLSWLKAHTKDRSIYNEYYTATGEPVDKYDAASTYGYVAQIAAAVGDKQLYHDAVTVLKGMTADKDNTIDGMNLDPSDPLYGSTQYAGNSAAFNDMNALLGYLLGQ